MTRLDEQQKQLIFDYCVGLSSKEQTRRAEALIGSSQQAADIYGTLKSALSPLDILGDEECPEGLAQGTVWRLNKAARSSELKLEQLLAAEQTREAAVKTGVWVNIGKRLVTAAVFVVAGSILITALNFARQKYWQYQCQMQLGRVFQGVTQYANDHDGQMPAVATSAGSPWWKVGYQGNENQSNTRHVWLLVKGRYVDAADFICPGAKHRQTVEFAPGQLKNLNEFPARGHITYSFLIPCHTSGQTSMRGRGVLTADLNPLFERLPHNYSGTLELRLNKDLLNTNSPNHKRHGQNILFNDGSVQFQKTRHVGILEDDIFTLQNTQIYKGVEVPMCETDLFVAP